MNGAAATRLSASAMASANGCEYMTALSPAIPHWSNIGPMLVDFPT